MEALLFATRPSGEETEAGRAQSIVTAIGQASPVAAPFSAAL